MANQISSRDNYLIKSSIKICKSSKIRKIENSFFIEGLRLSMDAIESLINIKKFFYTKKAKLNWPGEIDKIIEKAKDSYLVSENVAEALSETKTPQGFFCICEMVQNDLAIDDCKKEILLIGLENIQDPSNMGSIIRTAEALGIDGIVLSKDCCDIYNPKVIRGSMGGIFRLPFLQVDSLVQFIDKLNLKGYKTYATTPQKGNPIITDVDFNGKNIVIIGNEANGISKDTMLACSKKLNIPMKGRAESLNASVAANIIMWEMIRKR